MSRKSDLKKGSRKSGKTLNPVFDTGVNGEVLLPELMNEQYTREPIYITTMVQAKAPAWRRIVEGVVIGLIVLICGETVREIFFKNEKASGIHMMPVEQAAPITIPIKMRIDRDL